MGLEDKLLFPILFWEKERFENILQFLFSLLFEVISLCGLGLVKNKILLSFILGLEELLSCVLS